MRSRSSLSSMRGTRTKVYIGQHGVNLGRRPTFRRWTAFRILEANRVERGEKRSSDRSNGLGDVMWKRTRPTFNNFIFSTSPRLTPSALSFNSPSHLLLFAVRGRFLHHGRRCGRLGLHLQDGDGRRVGFRVFLREDEDLAPR